MKYFLVELSSQGFCGFLRRKKRRRYISLSIYFEIKGRKVDRKDSFSRVNLTGNLNWKRAILTYFFKVYRNILQNSSNRVHSTQQVITRYFNQGGQCTINIDPCQTFFFFFANSRKFSKTRGKKRKERKHIPHNFQLREKLMQNKWKL